MKPHLKISIQAARNFWYILNIPSTLTLSLSIRHDGISCPHIILINIMAYVMDATNAQVRHRYLYLPQVNNMVETKTTLLTAARGIRSCFNSIL